MIVRHSLRLPPGRLQRRNRTVGMDEEGHAEPEDWEPTDSEDSGVTLLEGLCIKIISYCSKFHYVVQLN